MKALVLAGGSGTRLRPFTHSMPKQLMPVANQPVLLHCLRDIRAFGVTEVGMIAGNRADEIRAVVGDGHDLGLEITYIQQDEPLGLAHCVLIARDFLGDEDFAMYLGDNILLDAGVDAAEQFRLHRPDAMVIVTKVDDPSAYGIAEVDLDGRVTAVVEKPRAPRSDMALTGVYFFTPAIHDAVRRVTPSWRGELEITDAIQDLIEHDYTVTAHLHSGYWADTGSVDGLLDCSRVLLNSISTDQAGSVDSLSRVAGPVVIEPGAQVVRSRLEGPVTLGAGTVVRESYLGPHTAVSANCSLTQVSIAESIVLEGASLSDVSDISWSVIGRKATIRGQNPPARTRLIVGDHANIELAT